MFSPFSFDRWAVWIEIEIWFGSCEAQRLNWDQDGKYHFHLTVCVGIEKIPVKNLFIYWQNRWNDIDVISQFAHVQSYR